MNWKEVFTADVRALAVLRISLALLLIYDASLRLCWIDAFLTDWGVMPRDLAEQLQWGPGMFSIHYLSTDPTVQGGLLVLAMAVAGSLLVGFQTRLATGISLLLLMSVHSRNPDLQNTGDGLLVLLLLWSIFLPLGAVWSVDASRRDEPAPTTLRHPAVVVLMFQAAIVYWFVVINRFGMPQWFERGNALELALRTESYTTDFGEWWLATLPWSLKPMTWAAMLVEGLGPFLAFIPWKNSRFRIAAVLLFVSTHIMFGTMLEVGMFWAVSCTSWLIFLPTELFDALERRLPLLRIEQRPTQTRWQPIAGAIVVLLFAGQLAFNVHMALPKRKKWMVPLNSWARTALLATGNHRQWMVYSPPPRSSGWPVVVGTLADGTEVDLWTESRTVTHDKPEDVGDLYVNQRWRKILYDLNAPRRAFYRREVSNYLAYRWEKKHPGERVQTVELVYYVQYHGKGRFGQIEREDLGHYTIRH